MKKKGIFLLLAVAASTMVFLSCKKDKNKPEEEDPDAHLPPLTNVVGYWVGKYGGGSATPSVDYAFLVKSEDNKIVVYENSADTANAGKAYGKWNFDPATKKFTAYYAYDQNRRYSLSGTLTHRSLIGTWGNLLEVTGGGTYKVRLNQ